ncbi:hypothetical protein AAF712_004125 [Marasmius tenuissimus]|uniref:Transglycosylase SLT domain-containing protein n=1 Tax=Marasmius tenuissimus TaxID=585030 RepID=A0ABR3A479_9AGAR
MKVRSLALVALYSVIAAQAANLHDSRSPRHSRRFSISRVESREVKIVNGKKCRVRNQTNTSVKTPASSNNTGKTSSVSVGGTSIGGLLNVASTCGDVGATADITNESGPNGALSWINCGVDGSGWRPQFVQVSDLKVVDLSHALEDPNSPFKACGPYIDKFVQYGNEFGIPPIMMASFAMQESTCNPSTTGGGGEVGLMQITVDKCGGAPGGNCYDPNYNIRTATSYFKNVLDQSGGNVLQAMGMYNGWQPGMTIQPPLLVVLAADVRTILITSSK